MKKTVFIIFYLHLAAILTAQVKTFSVYADKNQIVIGEQFKLTVKTVFASGHQAELFDIDSIRHFEIISRSKPDSEENGNELEVLQSFVLTSWDSGAWTIPAFSFRGKTSTAIRIGVSFSPFNHAQDYHDIKDIIEVEKPPRTTWYWYLLGILLFIVLGILLFPGSKKHETTDTPAPKITYGSKDAMRALTKLEMESASLSSKIFYTELVDILRSYLKLRIKTDPFTTATEMLADKIDEMEAPANLKKDVIGVLILADLGKFAKHEADNSEKQVSLQSVKKLIQATDNRH